MEHLFLKDCAKSADSTPTATRIFGMHFLYSACAIKFNDENSK